VCFSHAGEVDIVFGGVHVAYICVPSTQN